MSGWSAVVTSSSSGSANCPPIGPPWSRIWSCETLFEAMAGGDGFLFEVASSAILLGAEDGVETIRYRQRSSRTA